MAAPFAVFALVVGRARPQVAKTDFIKTCLRPVVDLGHRCCCWRWTTGLQVHGK